MPVNLENLDASKLNLEKEEHIAVAVSLLKSEEDETVKSEIIDLMSDHSDPLLFSTYFVEGLSDESELVITSCLQGLELIAVDDSVVNRIHELLKHEESLVRQYAVMALCVHKNEKTDFLIYNQLKKYINIVEFVCCFYYLCKWLGQEHQALFMKQLNNEDNYSVGWACQVILASDHYEVEFEWGELEKALNQRIERENNFLKRGELIEKLQKAASFVSEKKHGSA